jgi:hypothetical protein
MSGSISWENESPVPDWPKEADTGVPEAFPYGRDYSADLALGVAEHPGDVTITSL